MKSLGVVQRWKWKKGLRRAIEALEARHATSVLAASPGTWLQVARDAGSPQTGKSPEIIDSTVAARQRRSAKRDVRDSYSRLLNKLQLSHAMLTGLFPVASTCTRIQRAQQPSPGNRTLLHQGFCSSCGKPLALHYVLIEYPGTAPAKQETRATP